LTTAVIPTPEVSALEWYLLEDEANERKVHGRIISHVRPQRKSRLEKNSLHRIEQYEKSIRELRGSEKTPFHELPDSTRKEMRGLKRKIEDLQLPPDDAHISTPVQSDISIETPGYFFKNRPLCEHSRHVKSCRLCDGT
jgi:hypothetical protein